jgi:small-conductance mechanosensitive channel
MFWNAYAPWLPVLGVAAVAALLALLAKRISRLVVFRVARYSPLVDVVVRQCNRAASLLFPLVALQAVWQGAPDDLQSIQGVRHVTGLLLIAAVTWLVVSAVRGVAEGVIKLHPVDGSDNLQARRIHTQTRVLSRIAMGAVLVAGVAFALMTFPGARQLGASLLASAGVAGLVAGIAARSVFGNLIAGLQIALSQPFRIDDVLIIEGEWGRVEEITGTYVVLRIWDERRLIIPLQWFVEHPFQNWTRSSAALLGAVFLSVDYSLPLEPLRREAQRVCEASPDWDKRVCLVQVTDATERSMQLRVLVSSASSGQNFDLRCAVREALIAFIQREHPESLPRLRADVNAADCVSPRPAVA